MRVRRQMWDFNMQLLKRQTAKRPAMTAAAAAVSLASMTGCGIGSTSASAPPVVPGAALHGRANGGEQPIIGATIQLYAAGSAGYGSAAQSRIAATVTTQAPGGTWSINGDYTCPSAASQMYLTASQGNTGHSNNPNVLLVAALGRCDQLLSLPAIDIDEVSTVAAVYALAPFTSGPANIGAPASNSTGLANAFADVNVLADITLGTSPGKALPAGAMAPVAEINTLADILTACVNSSGGSAGDPTPCGKLFAAANPGGTMATAPSDTFTAAMNIAQHPGFNVAGIYPLYTPSAAFQPTLPTQPNDFTLAINFTAGNLGSPSALAADAQGNVWITNASANTVTELSHSGAVLSGTGYTANLNTPSAIAIDASGDAWVTNKGNNTVSRLANASGNIGASPYSGGGLDLPVSIAFDSNGSAWIANSGSASVTQINSSGSILTNYMPAGASAPIGVGVNPH